MALFIFLAVVPGRRRWDALRPPDSRSQAGCTAPARAGAMVGWKRGDPFPVTMASLRLEQQPLPSPPPATGRQGHGWWLHGSPRGTEGCPWDLAVAAAPEAAQAGSAEGVPPRCRPGAPVAAGRGQGRAAVAHRVVRGCGEVSVGRWLLHKLIVF